MRYKLVLPFLVTCSIACLLVGCGENEISKLQTEVLTTTNNSADVNADTLVTINEDAISISGDGCVNNDGIIYIINAGTYELTGTGKDIAVLVDTEDDVNLILNNISITNSEGPVIYGNNSNSITIILAEGSENVLSDGSTYETDSEDQSVGKATISSNDDLYFTGNGKLKISGNFKHGIACDDSIVLDGGQYEITAVTDGIHANDGITISGGSYSIDAQSDIFGCDGDLVINDGTISGTSDDEGLEGKNNIYINGGTIDITVNDDGINAGNYIEINGGDINVSCKNGDAIDCNGCYDGAIVINGGNINAYGGNAPEGAIDNDNASVYINGGTIVATGAVNSPIDTENSTQITIVYGSFNANEEIKIVDSNGNTIFSTTPTISSSTMIISAPGFEEGKEYSIYAGDNVSYTFTVDGVVIEAGGSDVGMGQMGGRGQMGGHGQMGDRGQADGNGQMDGGFQWEGNDRMDGNFPGGAPSQMGAPDDMRKPDGSGEAGKREAMPNK